MESKQGVRVSTEYAEFNTNQKWKQAFNQVLFLNYDSTNPVTINQVVIPPAKVDPVNGFTYPSTFEIALNAGEINDSYFDIKFKKGSTKNRLIVVHTLYNYGLTPATT